METVRLVEVHYDHKDFIKLCGELDSYLNMAIGGEDKRAKYRLVHPCFYCPYLVFTL